jgi:transcriptional regulator with XRE-family HTH domain
LAFENEICFVKDSINYRIKKLRISKDYSQEEMADELGLSKSGYNKIETGVTDPSAKRLQAIAKILEVDITAFFTDSKAPKISEEPKTQYGFATKSDFEELVNMIKEVTQEVHNLKATVQKLEEAKPKTRKK